MTSKIISLLFLTINIFMISSCNSTDKKTIQYSGKDIRSMAIIERNKETKEINLIVNQSTDWKLYAGNKPETIDLSKPILTGSDKGTFAIEGDSLSRQYFMFETSEGTIILSERHLPMAGGYNFRDLGGFKTKEGRYTKWGKLFRSDDLSNLTDNDLKYLSSIPMTTIVDFRSAKEIEEASDKNPESLKTNISLSIEPGNVTTFEQMFTLSEAEMEQFMIDLNISLVTDSVIIDKYKQFFGMVQSEQDVPLMFHCSAGKDRTGMAAALILYAVGVDEETILNDYLSSNTYLADKYAPIQKKYPNMKALFEVRENYIKAGLEQIKKDHGSIENYLINVLNVDIEKMKEMFLY